MNENNDNMNVFYFLFKDPFGPGDGTSKAT